MRRARDRRSREKSSSGLGDGMPPYDRAPVPLSFHPQNLADCRILNARLGGHACSVWSRRLPESARRLLPGVGLSSYFTVFWWIQVPLGVPSWWSTVSAGGAGFV